MRVSRRRIDRRGAARVSGWRGYCSLGRQTESHLRVHDGDSREGLDDFRDDQVAARGSGLRAAHSFPITSLLEDLEIDNICLALLFLWRLLNDVGQVKFRYGAAVRSFCTIGLANLNNLVRIFSWRLFLLLQLLILMKSYNLARQNLAF